MDEKKNSFIILWNVEIKMIFHYSELVSILVLLRKDRFRRLQPFHYKANEIFKFFLITLKNTVITKK